MFVTVEGVDGSGKSTQIRQLAHCLKQLGHAVFSTYEPGGWGEDELRRLLLRGGLQHPKSELLLFCADRLEHWTRVIKPHLDQGYIVLCDRYSDSTVAYQCFARGNGEADALRALELFDLLEVPKPDVTFYLKLDPLAAWKRRSEHNDAFEREGVEFQRRVAGGFDWLARREGNRIVTVDGAQPVEVLAAGLADCLVRRKPTPVDGCR